MKNTIEMQLALVRELKELKLLYEFAKRKYGADEIPLDLMQDMTRELQLLRERQKLENSKYFQPMRPLHD